MKDRYSAAELAALALPGLPATVNGIRDMADREGWPFVEVPSRGRGGVRRDYTVPAAVLAHLELREHAGHLSALMASPHAKAGMAIGKKLAAEAEQARRSRADASAETLSRWPNLKEGQRARLLGRLDVVQSFQAQISAKCRAARNQDYADFAIAYVSGAAGVEPDTRTSIKKVSSRSLRRWVADYKAEGLAGLLDEKDGKASKGHGKIEDQPAMRELVVGLLVDFPHIKYTKIEDAIVARFRKVLAPVRMTLSQAHAEGLLARPDPCAIRRFVEGWKKANASALLSIANPDAWKNSQMVAHGSQSENVMRLNQKWELDSTPGDVMLLDGRHHIIGGIDVFSRRFKILISKTSKSVAVGSLVRRALLDWGVPESVKTDNGADYVAKYFEMVLDGLDIEHLYCPPFQGWHKPHIERGFRTFSHDLVELLPGYIGHNVAERKELEARASFAERLFQKDGVLEVSMTSADLQAFCDKWVETIYHHNEHDGLDGMTPWAKAAEWTQPVRRIANERDLDVLLAEAPRGDGGATVQKKGIKLDKGWYIAPELGRLNVGSRVMVRYDAGDLGSIFVFDDAGTFVCIAQDPQRTGISRAEFAAKATAMQKEFIREEKAALKAVARRANSKGIVQEILLDRATEAGKLSALPKPSVAHQSAGLSQAARAASARFDAPKAELPPDIARSLALKRQAEEKSAGEDKKVVALRTDRSQMPPETNFRDWKALEEKVLAGEAIPDPGQAMWFTTYPRSQQFRTMEKKFGAGTVTAAQPLMTAPRA